MRRKRRSPLALVLQQFGAVVLFGVQFCCGVALLVWVFMLRKQ